MLVTLSALIVAGAAPSFQQSAGPSQAADALAPVRQSAVAVTSRDSTRAWRSARRAQGDFESLRRRLLPHATLVGATGCDAVVGRYCFLQQVASDPPQEALEVVAARARLLTILDSLGAMIPGDRWILGQRVRYLIEAGRPQAADSLGVACAASATVRSTTSWCFALVGYTAQQYGKFPRADAAFSSGARRAARVGSQAIRGSRALRRTRRGTVSPRGRRAARLDDGRVLATRPTAVPDERERSAHGMSRAHHADVHRAGQPDDDGRLGARGRSRDGASLWPGALVHARRCAPWRDGAAADRRHPAPTGVQLLPRRARVRVAGSTDARGLGVSERGEQADLCAGLGD